MEGAQRQVVQEGGKRRARYEEMATSATNSGTKIPLYEVALY